MQFPLLCFNYVSTLNIKKNILYIVAVQNERQPRNTATIRPETLRDMEQGRALREAAVAVGVFG